MCYYLYKQWFCPGCNLKNGMSSTENVICAAAKGKFGKCPEIKSGKRPKVENALYPSSSLCATCTSRVNKK
ncbi:hypothetical protein CC79DRAFT_1330406 [Sarocladium strictum]